jgi:hypothetical protein
MGLLGAGITAVGAAYVINKVVLKAFGPPVVVLMVPVLEEGAKTAGAYLWQAGIIETHLFFGIVEACYDLWQGGNRVAAPLLSLAGHGLFGLVTWLVVFLTGSWLGGLVAGTLLHSIWNGVIVGMYGKPPGG